MITRYKELQDMKLDCQALWVNMISHNILLSQNHGLLKFWGTRGQQDHVQGSAYK